VVAALAQPPPFPAEEAGRRRRRGLVLGGAVLLGVGVALSAPGIYFAARAADEDATFNRGCTPDAPCSAEELRRRGDELQRSSSVAAALLAGGGAALVAGAALLGVGVHRGLRLGVAALAGAAALVLSGPF